MTQPDAVAVQLCLSAGLTQEQAEALIFRVTQRVERDAEKDAEIGRLRAAAVPAMPADEWLNQMLSLVGKYTDAAMEAATDGRQIEAYKAVIAHSRRRIQGE